MGWGPGKPGLRNQWSGRKAWAKCCPEAVKD